jgi:hypothetical protein
MLIRTDKQETNNPPSSQWNKFSQPKKKQKKNIIQSIRYDFPPDHKKPEKINKGNNDKKMPKTNNIGSEPPIDPTLTDPKLLKVLEDTQCFVNTETVVVNSPSPHLPPLSPPQCSSHPTSPHPESPKQEEEESPVQITHAAIISAPPRLHIWDGGIDDEIFEGICNWTWLRNCGAQVGGGQL